MPELRRDPIIGQWVIVKTKDSLGPEAYTREDHTLKQSGICQFCVGKEKQTPGEVWAVRNGSQPNQSGWELRVVPNKFPALKIEGDLDKRGYGIFDISNGIGAHEVVIETPDHGQNFADFSEEKIVQIIEAYQNRCIDLAKDKRFKYVMIFRNFGESAGASLEHAHSQIIALPMVPKYVLEELEGSEAYFQYRGRCVYCDMIHQEYEDKERIITENNDFVSFCPFVSRYPFESWILPKKHSSQFSNIPGQERKSLAGLLKEVMGRIKKTLSNPSYNFYLHISPVNYDEQGSFHWHIEIIPKLTRVAGFEWGTGFYVVPTDPADGAKHLRNS